MNSTADFDPLGALAHAAGLVLDWHDWRGRPQRADPDVLKAVLAALDLPAASVAEQRESLERLRREQHAALPPLIVAEAGQWLDLGHGAFVLYAEDERAQPLEFGHEGLRVPERPGYYRLECSGAQHTLAVAPRRACGAAQLGLHGLSYGLAAQVYGLRRPGDGGVGDFTALAECARAAAAQGAQALVVSPVHALFSADVHRYGPYAPSSRLWRNAGYVDPAEFAGAEGVRAALEATGLSERWAALEAQALIDWPQALATRLAVLREIWTRQADALLDGRGKAGKAFRAWRLQQGQTLQDHAVFEALHAAQFGADLGRWNWRQWPAQLRDARSPAVAAFAAEQEREVAFHAFLQWLADRGLAAAQRAARAAGMRLGLIADLAVGTDGGGSQAWSRPDTLLQALSLGAPPDALNTLGQNWGLTTFSPRALQRQGFAPFIELLRAGLRHAGGLRIDHVLGLRRMWLAPQSAPPGQGVYLQYPLDELLRLIALESWRHRALIVGEDLGTVPEGFRERLAQTGVLGMRVLWFECEHGYFTEPARWSGQALAMTTTHDLPTAAGWWKGRDLEWRQRLGQIAPDSTPGAEQAQRAEQRLALWNAYRHAGVTRTEPPVPEDAEPAVDAAIAFVARTAAPLAVVPLEDIFGLEEQPNLPGTLEQHPNWRRRLPQPTLELLEQPAARARLGVLARRAAEPEA